jgi:hypothetical protein
VKEIVLPAHGLDMGMFGDDPERIEALRPRNAERIVDPEPAIGIMKAMIGVGCGIDERRGNVGREVGVVTQAQIRTLWFARGTSRPAISGVRIFELTEGGLRLAANVTAF